ncbi:hypothetical protein ACFL0Y_00100 [Patescibacteria group bacterium]
MDHGQDFSPQANNPPPTGSTPLPNPIPAPTNPLPVTDDPAPTVPTTPIAPPIIPAEPPKARNSKKIAFFVLFFLIFCLGGVGAFFLLEKPKITEKATSPEELDQIEKVIEVAQETERLNSPVNQTLEKIPTTNALNQETPISVTGETQAQGDSYSGSFAGGMALSGGPGTEDVIIEFKGNQEAVNNNLEAAASLMILEARDINDTVGLVRPISVSTFGSSDLPDIKWDSPGFFYESIVLPTGTNSLVLRVRNGAILDRVYMENWEPEIKLSDYPQKVGSTDKFNLRVELLPVDKAYPYSLNLIKATDQSVMGMIGGSLDPKIGTETVSIDLNGYPFTASGTYLIQAKGFTFFKTKTYYSEPISIELSSENIPITISSKEKKIRTQNEEDFLRWSHIFYGYDVDRGLVEMCEKEERCFELTWTGQGVKFLKSAFKKVGIDENGREILGNVSINDPEDFEDKLTTQLTSIECLFRGIGPQAITLEIKENGKSLGTDTYGFEVQGKESLPTICRTPASYFFNTPDKIP